MINDLDFLFAEKTSILILKDKLTHYPNSPWKDTYINMPARYIHYFQAYLDAHPIQQQKAQRYHFNGHCNIAIRSNAIPLRLPFW